MEHVQITIGKYVFTAQLLSDRAPNTCREFKKLLPYRNKLIQARWSGESAWIPMGNFNLNVGMENQMTTPNPGEILFYPGGISETEILFPYGQARFACKHGGLSGNLFLKIVKGEEHLPAIGELVLRQGQQDILFSLS